MRCTERRSIVAIPITRCHTWIIIHRMIRNRERRGGAMRKIYGPSLGVVCLLVALVGCAGSGNPGGQSSAVPASSPSAQAVRVVALGDSDTTGTGDPTGQGW